MESTGEKKNEAGEDHVGGQKGLGGTAAWPRLKKSQMAGGKCNSEPSVRPPQ